jgi:CDP-diacylglycerol--inositol 3-phosphatidyltransferase
VSLLLLEQILPGVLMLTLWSLRCLVLLSCTSANALYRKDASVLLTTTKTTKKRFFQTQQVPIQLFGVRLESNNLPQILPTSMTTTNTTTTAENVLLYVPNLIGYGRVICTVTSLVLMLAAPQYWIVAIALYVGSFVGDLVDGLVARKLNQTSTFGGLLDMVTDRCSTLGLLFVLANSYQHNLALQLTFLFLCLLDISSHWCQMYSTSALGKHHKSDEGNQGRHFLVRWFYKYYYFFGYLCVGAEFTYVIAYALPFTQDYDSSIHNLLTGILWAVIPGCVMKQFVNISQLSSACYAVAQYDADTKNK